MSTSGKVEMQKTPREWAEWLTFLAQAASRSGKWSAFTEVAEQVVNGALAWRGDIPPKDKEK